MQITNVEHGIKTNKAYDLLKLFYYHNNIYMHTYYISRSIHIHYTNITYSDDQSRRIYKIYKVYLLYKVVC